MSIKGLKEGEDTFFSKYLVVSFGSTQAAQAQNTRSCMFFFLLSERSAKRDMGHILLPNNRIGSRET